MDNATTRVNFRGGAKDISTEILLRERAACVFCKSGCSICNSRALGAHELAELEQGLNAAAEKAGQESGYKVIPHSWHDCYRDRWGYKVTGPDEERALAWIAKKTKGHVSESRVPVDSEWVTTRYVETGSYYIGD